MLSKKRSNCEDDDEIAICMSKNWWCSASDKEEKRENDFNITWFREVLFQQNSILRFSSSKVIGHKAHILKMNWKIS